MLHSGFYAILWFKNEIKSEAPFTPQHLLPCVPSTKKENEIKERKERKERDNKREGKSEKESGRKRE